MVSVARPVLDPLTQRLAAACPLLTVAELARDADALRMLDGVSLEKALDTMAMSARGPESTPVPVVEA